MLFESKDSSLRKVMRKLYDLSIRRSPTAHRLAGPILHRIYIDPDMERKVANDFHRLYYESGNHGKTWKDTFWLGVPTQKCPLDLWLYQEIIFRLKPDKIIETGTADGGSALFLASMCELVNNGEVVTIDIVEKLRPTHKRITYLHGSSTSEETARKVESVIENANRVMVILDSDHEKAHVSNELSIYSKFVTVGSYLIVEDTNLNGHPAAPFFGPGPMEALEEFLRSNKNFVVDEKMKKFYLSFNPKGYLMKTK